MSGRYLCLVGSNSFCFLFCFYNETVNDVILNQKENRSRGIHLANHIRKQNEESNQSGHVL